MPSTPVSQHHSTAPGPPRAMAVDTPMILPVPKVAANVVASAPKGETRWRGGLFFPERAGPPEEALGDMAADLSSGESAGSGRRDIRMALPICRWGMCRWIVKYRWTPRSRSSRGPFHRNWLMADNKRTENPSGRRISQRTIKRLESRPLYYTFYSIWT